MIYFSFYNLNKTHIKKIVNYVDKKGQKEIKGYVYN